MESTKIALPDINTKKELIKTLNNSLSTLYEFRRKTIFDFSSQIKQLNEKLQITLKSFENAIKQHRQLISQINLTVDISNSKENKLNEILSLDLEDSLESLGNLIDIFNKSNFFIDERGNIGKNNSIIYESTQIVLFREDSKRIVRTDLNDFSSTTYDISLDEKKTRYISMCLIPENSVFCYGNYMNYSSSAFIIEANNNVKQLIDAPYKLGLSGTIYWNGNIYVFGGCDGNYVNNAFKYNMLENTWKIIKSMPVASLCVSCIARKNKILLSGREHTKIYFYDIIENYYAELHDAQSMFRKIVCGNDNNYYVIETGGNIYETDKEWEIWNIIGIAEIENTDLMGYRVLWKNKVYFTYHSHELYEFDLKLKSIKSIKKV